MKSSFYLKTKDNVELLRISINIEIDPNQMDGIFYNPSYYRYEDIKINIDINLKTFSFILLNIKEKEDFIDTIDNLKNFKNKIKNYNTIKELEDSLCNQLANIANRYNLRTNA